MKIELDLTDDELVALIKLTLCIGDTQVPRGWTSKRWQAAEATLTAKIEEVARTFGKEF